MKSLYKLKSIVPLSMDAAEIKKAEILEKLKKLNLPTQIDIGLDDRSMNEEESSFAEDILKIAKTINEICKNFNVKACDLKSFYNYALSDHETTTHSIGVLGCLTDLKPAEGRQALVNDSSSEVRQILIVKVFEAYELVELEENGLKVRTTFAGVLGREILISQKGKSKLDKEVGISQTLELIPIETVSVLN
jgi:hypothetical protein